MSVSVEIAGAIARVTVHRPEARNAMSFAMYDAFFQACEALDARPDVRVVVLRGGGGTFIAGTDIREFLNVRTGEEALAYERRMDAVVGRLERMAKVTIAMLEGHTTGGGFTIALACDLRYAASNARLGVPIARTLGNCLSMTNYARLVDAVGPARARELLLTARLLSAEEAHGLGLVNA
ncbi:MAG: enoyl-CoA hydratase-related protein, partial [Armatimonadota bacterium]